MEWVVIILTLREFYNDKMNGNPLIYSIISEDYLSFYHGNYALFDFNWSNILFPDIEMKSMVTDVDTWNKVVSGVILRNDYKYKKLFNTMKSYDFMENMNLTKTTESVIAKRKVTNTFGKRVESMEHGQRQTDFTKGESVNKESFGIAERDEVHAKRNETTQGGTTESTNSLRGFNQTDLVKNDSTETKNPTTTVTDDAYTDTFIDKAKENSITDGQRKDTTVNLTFTDKNTNEAYEDSVNTDGYTDKTTETTVGDASLRATASVIKEERDIAYLQLYDIIFNDILEATTNLVFTDWG